MENKEFIFKGMTLNGIGMLVLNLFLYIASVGLIALSPTIFSGATAIASGVAGGILFIVNIIVSCGFVKVEPGEARVMMFFGKYRGTFNTPGYHWINPFITPRSCRCAHATSTPNQ